MGELIVVCPRCRAGQNAWALRPEGQGALECTNDHCVARYPVLDGVPVVFGQPEVLDPVSNPPWDVLRLPASTLCDMVRGMDSSAPLAAILGRLSRHLWNGFHDWLPARWQVPGHAENHARDAALWLGERAWGNCVSLGCAAGREAWELTCDHVVLVDAWLPALLATRRLLLEGSLEFPMQVEGHRFEPVRLEVPRPPTAAVSVVACNLMEGTLAPGQFAGAVALNLLDSIQDPLAMLVGAQQLVRSGGYLAFTSPLTFRSEFTPRHHQPDAALGKLGAGTEDVLAEFLEARVQPALARVDRAELPWVQRNSDREAVLYRSLGLLYAKP